MALLTSVTLGDADRATRAHGLGACACLLGVEAGSVNTNYFVDTEAGRRFLRVYEEQEAEGVAYEWALLAQLRSKGVPVPSRVPGPGPGVCRVAGKCAALFEIAAGEERCANMWHAAHYAETGRVLARAHLASADFGWRRASRFDAAGVGRRLALAEEVGRAELMDPIRELRAALDATGCTEALPRGVVHGDVFRDNLRFEDDVLVCVLDWESAADGPLVLDLGVAILALAYADDFRWNEARTLVDAYVAERPLSEPEWRGLRGVAVTACVRFATTRIHDFYLRALGQGTQPKRDFRRFLDRMRRLQAMSDDDFATRLGA